MNLQDLKIKKPPELLAFAEEQGVEGAAMMRRQELMFAILQKLAAAEQAIFGTGTIEVLPDGFGYLRSMEANYLPGADDIYVSPTQVRKFGLRTGDTVEGEIRAPKDGERYFAMVQINKINFDDPESLRHRINFDSLTPLYPDEKLKLEMEGGAAAMAPAVKEEEGGSRATSSGRVSSRRTGTLTKKAGSTPQQQLDISTRVIDLIAPIGKGQRALIVSPPRTGKTVLLQNIAHAITANNPEVYLMVLLVDERPEEVTHFRRVVPAEVLASTSDSSSDSHIRLSRLAIERSQRLVEAGRDVVILLDSLTRLGRASNREMGPGGRTMSGGVDNRALQFPRQFFGAARNCEGSGSLTILATALIETGSRMDEVIFQEFKGTGNMELILDRAIADRRIFPAVDVLRSGTRREELLVPPEELVKRHLLRRALADLSPVEAAQFLIDKLSKTPSNAVFLGNLVAPSSMAQPVRRFR
jgi:transcription termination factor Rho